jgi:hypothetical protein
MQIFSMVKRGVAGKIVDGQREWVGGTGRGGAGFEGGVYTIISYLHALACACMQLHEREGIGGKKCGGAGRGWEGLGGAGAGRGGVSLREVCIQLFYICLRCIRCMRLHALHALHACFKLTHFLIFNFQFRFEIF